MSTATATAPTVSTMKAMVYHGPGRKSWEAVPTPGLLKPTVKVIVPGLRHFWPRLGPGRLYDVPVRMGWLAAPLTEAQLNPVPFYF